MHHTAHPLQSMSTEAQKRQIDLCCLHPLRQNLHCSCGANNAPHLKWLHELDKASNVFSN